MADDLALSDRPRAAIERPHVRIATPAEVDAVMELAVMGCEENAFTGFNKVKLLQDVWAALNLDKGICGVIGAPGSQPLEGAVLLRIGTIWYSMTRRSKRGLSSCIQPFAGRVVGAQRDLAEFSMDIADKLGMPLTIGVLSDHRTAAKVRLYSRIMGKPAGAYWMYRPGSRALSKQSQPDGRAKPLPLLHKSQSLPRFWPATTVLTPPAQNAAQTPFQQYSTNPNAFVAPITPTQAAGIAEHQRRRGRGAALLRRRHRLRPGRRPVGQPLGGQRLAINQYENPYLSQVMGSTEARSTSRTSRRGGPDRQRHQQRLLRRRPLGDRLGGAAGPAEPCGRAGLLGHRLGRLPAGAGGRAAAAGRPTWAPRRPTAPPTSRPARRWPAWAPGAQAAALWLARKRNWAPGRSSSRPTQAGKTALYNQFLQQQSYPFQTAQYLANIAEGTGALVGIDHDYSAAAVYLLGRAAEGRHGADRQGLRRRQHLSLPLQGRPDDPDRLVGPGDRAPAPRGGQRAWRLQGRRLRRRDRGRRPARSAAPTTPTTTTRSRGSARAGRRHVAVGLVPDRHQPDGDRPTAGGPGADLRAVLQAGLYGGQGASGGPYGGV